MTTFTITDAELEHLPAMVELLQHLFAQEHDFTPNPAQQARALTLILSHPQTGRLFVATSCEQVLGMVSLLFTVSTATGGYAAWLEDLVVRPSHRNRGIGSALLEHVISWAKAEGLGRITLLTDCDNERAQALYTHKGFNASRMLPLRLLLR
jgi:GNAT superfamily N-acetyltransferase